MTSTMNRDRSLEELERDYWPDPPDDATRLILTVHALRHRPIGTLAVEDLRLLIGQNVGLPHLLPLALEILRESPLAEGDMYEGDLLSAVVTRNPATWSRFPDLERKLRAILLELADLPSSLREKVEQFLGSTARS
ncbi:contact-dependent growth inhibition system immunity protein [Microbispora sp. NPDC046933]|uniref:contact-dependent growth inhibition system immunity protein n=1 Tax=Microbispora sp. NPDC046933 TaxID=3155618 RepID=UPI003401B298